MPRSSPFYVYLWAALLLAACSISNTLAFTTSALTSTASATASTQLYLSDTNQQAQYGTDLDLPASYVRCGKCQSIYALTEDDLGDKGKGRCVFCMEVVFVCVCVCVYIRFHSLLPSLLLSFESTLPVPFHITVASNAASAVILGFNRKIAS